MLTQATVISVDGAYAIVESHRKAACDACHKTKDGEECSICTLAGGDNIMRIRAKNTANAKTGDKVNISTDSKRVLGYAWLVFLLPLLIAGLGWWLGVHFWEKEIIGVGCAIVGMALSFFCIWIYSKISVSRRCDAEIVSIIENKN